MILNGSHWPRLSQRRLAAVVACGTIAIGVSLTTAAAQVEPAGSAIKPPPNVDAGKTAADSAKSSTSTAHAASTSPSSAPSKLKARRARSSTSSPASSPQLPAPPTGLPPTSRDAFLKILPGDDETQRLLKERHNAAVRGLQLSEYQYEVGTANVGLLLSAARGVLEARLALAKTPEERIRAGQDYLDFVTSCWKRAKAKLDIGGAAGFRPLDEAQAREAMFDAKLKLAQSLPAKTGKEPATSPSSPVATSSPALGPESTPASSPQVRTGTAPAWLTAKPLEPAAGDDELPKLLKARYNAALKSLQGHLARTQIDPAVPIMPVIAAARALFDAEVSITPPQETVRPYQCYLEFMTCFDDLAGKRWKTGNLGFDEVNAVHAARLDAEIKLMQAKAIATPGPRRTGAFVQSLEVHVRIAEAEVNAARAVVDQSEAEMKRAVANVNYRRIQLDRLQTLHKQKAISNDLVDEGRHAYDEATASVEAARASIRAVEAQVPIKQAQLEQTKLELEQAKAAGNK